MHPVQWLHNVRERLSIGRQIVMVCASLAVVTATTVAIGAAMLARQQAVQSANAVLSSLASDMAQRLDARMAERYREVRRGVDPAGKFLNPHLEALFA